MFSIFFPFDSSDVKFWVTVLVVLGIVVFLVYLFCTSTLRKGLANVADICHRDEKVKKARLAVSVRRVS